MNEREIIKEQLKKLPKDIRDAIVATDLSEKFKIIVNKRGLQIDQGGALETETMLVLLGLEHPDDYIKNLIKEAKIPREEAEQVAEDVGRMIFLPIRASLRKIHEEEPDEQEEVLRQAQDEKTAEKTRPSFRATPVVSQKKEAAPSPAKEGGGLDAFREKMEKQVKLGREEVDMSPPTKPATPLSESHKKINADPYKESVDEKDLGGIKQEGIKTKENVESRIQNLGKENKNQQQKTGPEKTPLQSATKPKPTETQKPKTETQNGGQDMITDTPAVKESKVGRPLMSLKQKPTPENKQPDPPKQQAMSTGTPDSQSAKQGPLSIMQTKTTAPEPQSEQLLKKPATPKHEPKPIEIGMHPFDKAKNKPSSAAASPPLNLPHEKSSDDTSKPQNEPGKPLPQNTQLPTDASKQQKSQPADDGVYKPVEEISPVVNKEQRQTPPSQKPTATANEKTLEKKRPESSPRVAKPEEKEDKKTPDPYREPVE